MKKDLLKDLLVTVDGAPKIWMDLDGVLADFDRRVELLTGKKPTNLSKKEMWKAIMDDSHFFLKLEWINAATPLWNLIKKYDHAVLTGLPSRSEGRDDKIAWVKKKCGNNTEVIVVPKLDKQLYAASNHILVDDNQMNIDQWNAAGGIGIFHNGDYDRTILLTKEAIKKIEKR